MGFFVNFCGRKALWIGEDFCKQTRASKTSKPPEQNIEADPSKLSCHGLKEL